ncbi:MAG TPA: hypothetical protein VKU00_07405 [Chthonomonadaceae bacterium]|nr:hypothetical protein [Chthonomonadaceae bacterium]
MSDDICRSERQPHFSAEEVKELEHSLLEDPEDLQARTELLIHYMMESFHSKNALKSHMRHSLWLIQHHPDSDLAGTPFVLPQRRKNKEALEDMKWWWIHQVANYPENAMVLGNAAKFFIHTFPDDWLQARNWLHAAEQLDSTNPEWPEQAGLLFEFEGRQLQGEEKKIAVHNALQYYVCAYDLTLDEERRVLLLNDLARNAFLAGEFSHAGEYASKLLESTSLGKDGDHDWNYGNALHWSHIVLGKLALQQGDREAAKLHLQEAGNTPGSPQLNSFGPDMTLARELLEQEEKEAVLAYLMACSKFWKLGTDDLAAWDSAIREDRIPDFCSSSCNLP